ncbi:MAG: hypothetical protein ACP5I3_01965 [Thermoproteus sp.]|jgi:endogenous inhibitor of DNA gyrase (YacG/DUF329 family)
MRYLAVVCPRCGMASAARSGAKSHVCPFCGARIDLERASVIASGSAEEVRKAVARHNEGARGRRELGAGRVG